MQLFLFETLLDLFIFTTDLFGKQSHQADLSLWTCERRVDFGVFTNQMILAILTLNYIFSNSKTFIAGKSYLYRIRFWNFWVVNPTLYSLS